MSSIAYDHSCVLSFVTANIWIMSVFREWAKQAFPPVEIGINNQKILENLKSATKIQLIDLILALTVYLLV